MSSRKIMNHESAMLPRLLARQPYSGPMATRIETMNWIQRAVRRAKRVLAGKRP